MSCASSEAIRIAQDILRAWALATPEQRKRMVWSVFNRIRISSGTIASVRPKPERRRCSPRQFTDAVPTGFEPAISSLTGTYARPLHHGTVQEIRGFHTALALRSSILPPLGFGQIKEAASALPFTRRPCRCGQRDR